METRRTKYIMIDKVKDTGKTTGWEVSTGGWVLGYIKWDTGWRRYVMEPYTNSKWDKDCLKDIMEFLDDLMKERKNKCKEDFLSKNH